MANNLDFNEVFISNFSSLSVDQLDVLKEKFNEFYHDKLFENYFKQEIINNNEVVHCPRCGSAHIVKHGKDQFGDQRYRCKNENCKVKTFTVKTDTLLYYSKCKKSQWLVFFECLFNKETVKTTADKVGICENTVLAWRHKTMYLIYKMIEHDKMTGLIHLDETFFDCIYKGIGNIEFNDKKRGISNDKIGVACAIDETNRIIMKVINRGRPTSKSLENVFKGFIDANNTVVTDSLRSYHQLHDALGFEWIKIPSGKKSYKGHDLTKINQLHGNLKQFLSCFRGITVTYLQGYISLYELLERFKRYYQPKSYRMIVKAILTTPMKYRGYDFNSNFTYD